MSEYDFKSLTQLARDKNLAEYFCQSGYTTKHHGREVYIEEFPGLCINEDTGSWYNHYEGEGGNNSIDCLVKTCGHNFNQAVYELTGRDVTDTQSKTFKENNKPQYTSPPKTLSNKNEKKEVTLPERDENMRRVFAYFCKERKIPSEIVEQLAHEKLLYQSKEEVKTTVNDVPQTFKKRNAVFVHRNKDGEAIGGEVQGVTSFKRYKGVVKGTGDSVFSFTPFPTKDNKTKTAYLFESAIDLMSFYAFCKKEKMQGVTLISMAGLKPTIPKQLEADGVKVYSCVDNDDAGRRFERENNFRRGADLLEKAGVKDWNELLKLKLENPKAVKDFVPEVEKKTFFKSRGR